MAEVKENWKDEIREKFSQVFKDNPEDLVNILFFLDKEDKVCQDNIEAPHWRSLKAVLKSDEAFRLFALRFSEEIREATNPLRMAEAEENWKDKIRKKLYQVFKDNPEELANILLFLDKKDIACEENVNVQHWRSLKAVLKADEAFRSLALRLSKEIREATSPVTMAEAKENWKDKIRGKLSLVFKDNPEDLVNILFFLDQEDKACQDDVDAPHWSSLKTVLNEDEAFRLFSLRLSEETRKAAKLPEIIAADEIWKDKIRAKIMQVLKDNPESYIRLVFFLNEEDKAYKHNIHRPYASHWTMLKAKLESDVDFEMCVKQLLREAREAEIDQGYRTRLYHFYEEMLENFDKFFLIDSSQKLDRSKRSELSAPFLSLVSNLEKIWNVIPTESKASVLNSIKELASRGNVLMSAIDEFASLGSKTCGKVAMVSLAGVYLAYTAQNNITRWWKGEISGKRCVKNVLDATFTTGAGMAGGILGGFLLCGPIGGLVGGILGGFVGAAGMAYISDYLTQKLFGIPQDVALENAYRYLGVEMTASNAVVNKAFHRLCLQHHPDKGGKTEDFIILQAHMAVIKLARENIKIAKKLTTQNRKTKEPEPNIVKCLTGNLE
ncbi:uncharacterized protein LOC114541302 [Dendronephthya gigantea]|uniref:uncharacterized protein LOC114541302 n=1 Tax=Dendronephthya gigantea TaxID=151771 RepID=UPI00106DCF51|nr:uncharacterized protein LOC114541302 [Dendronephthya gigantea]XP_028417048.1 uncharacterized protein LOC114541302 [Dendronephthya gigantea]